jgi:hypothetical protein
MTPSGLRAVCFAILLCSLSASASAQLIPIRTVPIAQGDQFQIFPSNTLGMGSVSIALPDSLQDPFVNPATGARLGAGRFVSAPTVYSLSRGAGGGRSLPLAALTRAGSWYGGLALALQQVEPSRQLSFDRGGLIVPSGPDGVAPQAIPEPDTRAHGNQYLFAMVGKGVPSARLSLGASVLWSGLHALDGVDLLYAGSRRVAQRGHSVDARLGLLKEWASGRSLEAVLLHNHFAATHDVTYAELFWDPVLRQTRERARLEHNADRTNTWGVHLDYELPLGGGASGWRVGWLATANRLSHPKIPNYEMANVPVIPRDPGRSSAFDFGIGLSKTRGPATFGVDVIFEPIRSYTWADAATPVTTVLGDTIAAGGKTIENRFRFANAIFRMGLSRDLALQGLGLQLGLVVRSVRYRLAQTDNVQLVHRALETGWLEWTPTWGLSLRFPELEIRYRGRVTHGAGRPAVQSFPVIWGRDVAFASGTILAAPTGPLRLTDVTTATHQISLSVPLR